MHYNVFRSLEYYSKNLEGKKSKKLMEVRYELMEKKRLGISYL